MAKAHRCTGSLQLSLLLGENSILRESLSALPKSPRTPKANSEKQIIRKLTWSWSCLCTARMCWHLQDGSFPGSWKLELKFFQEPGFARLAIFLMNSAAAQLLDTGKRLSCHISIQDPECWQPFLLFFGIISKCDQICEQATYVVHSFQIQDLGWLK